ncbi:MAG: DUF1572 domain-containing protein [Flavobacteriaceae bacterium]|nr:DUF1572 domain-containing protein [Flavobacteriaceae bacterium]
MENTSHQIGKHLTDVYFGGNWTAVNIHDSLVDVTWQQATQPISDFNTIATLTFHTHYFVAAILDVLEGRPLTAKDKYSFDHPPIHSQEDWKNMLQTVFTDVRRTVTLIEDLDPQKLHDTFVDPKYGNFYRNLHGLIEHTHYHLGQITFLKKMVKQARGKNQLSQRR